MQARCSSSTVGYTALSTALTALLVAALVSVPAFSQPVPDSLSERPEASDSEEGSLSIEVTGIRQLRRKSYINAVLLPVDKGVRKRGGKAKVDLSDCDDEGPFCGVATVKLKKVLAGARYKLRVCHTRRTARSCPLGIDGKTKEAGKVMPVKIDDESLSTIEIDLETLYP